jgi:hypothetical protein
MCFEVSVVSFGDEALAGLRAEVADWRAAARELDVAVRRLERQLADAQANVRRLEERLKSAASESTELGNAHVRQKDQLLQLCLDGEYERALDLLAFVEESWRAVNYGYKAGEVRQRIRDGARAGLEALPPRQGRERRRLGAVLERLQTNRGGSGDERS